MLSPSSRRAALVADVLSLLAFTVVLLARPSVGKLSDIEKKYVDVPSADGARESLKFITSKPHVAGTPGDHEVRARYKDT